MRTKPILVTVAALLVIAGVSIFTYRSIVSKPTEICQVCGRGIPKQTAFRMETARGTILACCPRCAMHHMLNHPDLIRQAWATDFSSVRMIPAQSAYYDEGGDVQYCTHRHASVERASEGIRVRVYDRCLPTLVAFATRDEAEAYRRQHGGRVLTYEESLEDIRSQLR